MHLGSDGEINKTQIISYVEHNLQLCQDLGENPSVNPLTFTKDDLLFFKKMDPRKNQTPRGAGWLHVPRVPLDYKVT